MSTTIGASVFLVFLAYIGFKASLPELRRWRVQRRASRRKGYVQL